MFKMCGLLLYRIIKNRLLNNGYALVVRLVVQTGCALGCARCPHTQLCARVLMVVCMVVRCGYVLWLCAVFLHNRLAQPHLLMRSALHKVRPEVAQRFLYGIRSFPVMRFCFDFFIV